MDPPRSLPSAGTDAFRILRLRELEGKSGVGRGRHVGGRTPSARWGRGPRAGVRDTQRSAGCIARAILGSPTRRGGHRVSSGGGWGYARGCWRAQPGDSGEAPYPAIVRKGADDHSHHHPQEKRMFPEPRESAGGRRVVRGTRAARAGEEGGHSPLPPSRPHCLSRLRPGPAP